MRLLDALPTVVAVAVGLAVVVLLAAAVFSRTNRHFLARRSTLEGDTVEPAADRMLHAFAEMSGDKSDALDVGTALAETQLLELAQIDRYNVIMNLIQRRLVKAHQRGGQIAQYFDHAVYEYPAQVYWTDAGWKKAELNLESSTYT